MSSTRHNPGPMAHVDAWFLRRVQPNERAVTREQPSRNTAQYLRVSTTQQGAALEYQRKEIARYAAAHDHKIVASFEDVGRSGVTLEKREGLSRLLKQVVSGDSGFDHVLVLDVSRWGRFQDPDEAAHYEFVCRANGVSVTYISEFVSSGAQGQLNKHVKRIMAADYVRQLSTLVRRAKRRRIEAGGAPGAWPRFMASRQVVQPDGTPGPVLRCGEFRTSPLQGLRLVGPGAEREQVIRRIFELFVEGGRSLADIADVLTQDGCLWADGTPWNRRRVGRALRQTLASGLQQYGRTRTVLGARGLETNTDLWGEFQAFETAVSPELFAAAQERFRALDGRPAYTRQELLDGLRRLLEDHGRITRRLIDSCPDLPSFRTYEARFGSLTSACRAMGYDRPQSTRALDPHGAPLDREQIILGLRTLHQKHGRVSLTLIQQEQELPSIRRIQKIFGSIPAAYEQAGLR